MGATLEHKGKVADGDRNKWKMFLIFVVRKRRFSEHVFALDRPVDPVLKPSIRPSQTPSLDMVTTGGDKTWNDDSKSGT